MTIKTITFFAFCSFFFGFQGGSCSQNRDDRWVTVGGKNERANLVIFFNKGTSKDQIADFYERVINLETEPLALRFHVTKDDFVGVAVNFSTEASPERRAQLKKQIDESPIVYKVYENVVPAEIKDL